MDLQSIPLKVRLEVAGKFWDYMKETKTKPETMAELRQLYVNVYRPLLDFPLGQRVKFASVLSCMKTSGFLKLSGEIIDYQVEQNPRSEVEEGQDVDTNQELPPQNAEKTSRKVKILKGPNGKEEENLDTKSNSSMGRQIIPVGVQLEVAKKFWDYINGTKTMPESKMELRKLYLNVYRPLLDFPLGRRVKFTSVLSCLKTSGFLKTAGEILFYQVERNPQLKVEEGQEITDTPLSCTACNNQEISLQNTKKIQKENTKKIQRKVKILKDPNKKEDENLETESLLSIGMASTFWEYMKETKTMPKTTVALQQLYLNVYYPLLDQSPGQFVKFSSVLSCMKDRGFLKVSSEKQEKIIYLAEVVEQTPLPRVNEADAENEEEKDFGDLVEVRKKLDLKRNRLVKDKGRVEMYPESNRSGVIDLGAININEEKRFELDIRNCGTEDMAFGYVFLESAQDCNVDTTSYEVTVENLRDTLHASGHINVTVEIGANNPGIFHVPLLFWFKCGKGKAFHIVKFIKAEVISNPESEPQHAVAEQRQEDYGEIAELTRMTLILTQSIYCENLMKDKGNVKIFPESNENGVIDLGMISEKELKIFELQVRNESDRKLVFGYVVLGSATSVVDSINYEVRVETAGKELDGFHSISVPVEISISNPGILHVPLAFWFKCGNGETFHIAKFITAEISSSNSTGNQVNTQPPVAQGEEDYDVVAELRKNILTPRHHLPKDNRNVTIYPQSNEDGVIDLGTINDNQFVEIYLRNEIDRNLVFRCVVLKSASSHVDEINYEVIVETAERRLDGFHLIPVPIQINVSNSGTLHIPLAFWFKCDTGETFHFVKFIKAEITRTSNLVNDVQPVLEGGQEDCSDDIAELRSNLTQSCSSMSPPNNPSKRLQLEVAETFWEYMNETKTKPETRMELRQLYLNFFSLNLRPEERFDFYSILSCMQTAGFLVMDEASLWDQGTEIIVYQEFKEHQEDTDISQLSAACSNQELPPPNTTKKTSRKSMKLKCQNEKGEYYGDTGQLREKLTTERCSMKDNGNVKIFPQSDENGVIDLGMISEKEFKTTELQVRNESDRKLVFGYVVRKSTSSVVDSINYEVRVETIGKDLDGFRSITVPVEISISNPGTLYVPLEFWFEAASTGETFHLLKFIKAEIIGTGNTASIINLVKRPTAVKRKRSVIKSVKRRQKGYDDDDDDDDSTDLRLKLPVQRNSLVRNRGDVEILPESNVHGVIDLGRINKKLTQFEIYIQIKSKGKLAFGYVVLGSATNFHVETRCSKVTVAEAARETLGGFKQILIPIEIAAHNPGIINVPLEFWMKRGKKEPFHITKVIKAEITRRQPYNFSVTELRERLLTQRHQLTKDKENITILPSSDEDGVILFGTVDMCKSKSVQLHIRNNCEKKHSFGYVVRGWGSDFHVEGAEYDAIDEEKRNMLFGHGIKDIPVKVGSNSDGVFRVVLSFWFKCGEREPFHIVKFIKAKVVGMQFVSPYVRRRPGILTAKVQFIEGKPPAFSTMPLPERPESYNIPQTLQSHARTRNLDGYLTEIFYGDLTAQNHRSRFSNLLHVEEIQMQRDIQRYNMKKAKLRKVSEEYLALAVPGLAENRPSLIFGDRLFVHKLKRDGTEEGDEYEGFVHQVEHNEVHLKFCSEFHEGFVKNTSFSVRFTFSRTPLRLMHRAVEKASSFLRQLPPKADPPNFGFTFANIKRLRLCDPNIANNEEQKQAVENIVFGNSLPYPYLVFGGPGSGKTNTMVEAIKQVLKMLPQSKVLACAPSNSAADLILQRVSHHNSVPRSQMIRLNAYGRDVSSVHPKLMEFCRRSSDGFFCFPRKEEIMSKYRLVVITLISAGRLVSMGIGKSHFTHLFIDEAGHGMEPECLVPITGLYRMGGNAGGRLVLAGDPRQLGPVIRSPEAIKFGLAASLLERLMGPQFPCFNQRPGNKPEKIGRYDEKLVTKLLNNYRSHPAIIKLPNEMFYDNELRACADQLLRESLCHWNGLSKKGFPVVFEGVCGKDQREERSPSFFNPQEVSVVLRYVKDFKEARGISVKTEEIGIISPYHRQVQKIRESLKKNPLDIRDIKVGSVEEFQGQERKVIIVSTVRSSEEFLHIDAIHKLGFLRNPKRFNVAITRAKALLIVIGNPYVLCRDKRWRRFIQYCMDNGSYKGCTFQMPGIDDENLAAQFANLGLDSEGTLCSDKGLLTSTDLEDQEWKPGEE